MSTTTSLQDVLPSASLSHADEGPLGRLAAGAEAVVHPASTEEVVETVRWAAGNGVGVLPVGTGVRTRRPREDRPFVVLSTDRLAGLEIYEPADLTLTGKAGTRLADIGATLGAHRQWLPFDPPGVAGRTLGGLVASGESGPVATGYGELRNHVLGATVVCGDGRVLKLGGRVVKNVAGFDLLRPVVGSRGRLGVITSVCLRAFPVPAEDRVLVHRADELAALAPIVRAVRTAPILPASLSVWSSSSLDGATLLVRLHGARSTVDADQATLERRAGVSFELATDPSVVGAARDGGAAQAPLALRVSVLPADVLEALSAVRTALGESSLFADAYSGHVLVGAADADAHALEGLKSTLEALGGSLGIDAPDDRQDLAAVASRPTQAEADLATRLEGVFDPPGTFWPCRH